MYELPHELPTTSDLESLENKAFLEKSWKT